MQKREIKRRDFLKLSATVAVGALATACAPATPAPTAAAPVATQTPVIIEKQVEVTKQVQVTVEVPTKRSEPPLLAPLVASGKLPPVDQRLPVTPVVVGGRDAIGTYGGEVRMIHMDPIWFTENYDLLAERMLYYSDFDNRTIVPNILESWEMNADATVFTIKLRKGMKYSTGDPLTTEDVRFWWEDCQLNTDLNSAPSDWRFRFGGKNAVFEFIDDFTFKITFAKSHGNFPAFLTRVEASYELTYPSKFMKPYHAKYADKATLDKMVADAKLTNWQALFNTIAQWGMGTWQGPAVVTKNYDFPVVAPWHITSMPAEGLYIWERNPYYWKIDLQGNQLPYIDNLRFDYTTNTDAVKLKVSQSEIDILGQHSVTMADYPFYKASEKTTDIKVGDYISCMGDRYVLFPQHYMADDAVMNKIVNDPRFVQALSQAIDRDEINQSLFFGTARMGQMAPMPESRYYKQSYGSAWATFNKDAAGKLLDDMGLKKGANGMRVRPDGKPLQYMIEHCGTRVGPVTGKLTEMITNYWREIGIDASTKEIQENLYNERMNNAQVQCGVWHADRCTDMLLHIEMNWYIPIAGAQGGASSKWAAWYAAADKTAAGLVEPPDTIKNLFNLFDQMQSDVTEDDRVAHGQQIFDWLVANPLAIGLLAECPAPLLVNKNLRNLPRPKAVIGWDSYGFSIYHPEAFYYEGGKRA